MALRRVLVRYKGVGASLRRDKHTPNKLNQSIKKPKAIESDGRR